MALEKIVASLSTPGAQSQYKTIANIGIKVSAAIEKLDEIGLSFDDPDCGLYRNIAEVRDDLVSAQVMADDRCDLILRADEDPQNGWKALTRYEKVIGSSSKSTNPEREKVFADCLKKVQEEKKKKMKITGPQFARSVQQPSQQSTTQQPFLFGPGWEPGNGTSGHSQGLGYEYLIFCFLVSFICLI